MKKYREQLERGENIKARHLSPESFIEILRVMANSKFSSAKSGPSSYRS